MSMDKNKKYKIGSKVYAHYGVEWRPVPGSAAGALFFTEQMQALIDEGLATEVEEPMVRTAVIEFNSCGHISSMRPYARQWFNINEEEAKSSTWDIVATRRPK